MWEIATYKPKFSDLYQAYKDKFGTKPPPQVWMGLEEIIPGMVEAARKQ